MKRNIAIILARGVGSHLLPTPKQFLKVASKMVMESEQTKENG